MSDTLHPVFIVGSGPGDPDLLTRKAERALRQADVVVYDRLVSDEILDLLPAGATRIFAGKAARNHHMPQHEINELLVSLAKSGKKVVRLKGGDPFVFGRGSEEAEELAKEDVPFEVIPGITASMGCTSYAGIPLTHRGLATGVKIVTGHRKEGTDLDLNWATLACPDTTLVIYMGLTNVKLITEKLMEHGLSGDTPAAGIQNGTTPKQRTIITTLEELPNCVERAGLKAPTLLIIGKVVSLAKTLNWHHTAEFCDETVKQAD